MAAPRQNSACRSACLCTLATQATGEHSQAYSARDRPRRSTRLTVGGVRNSQPSWVSTPAATNAATRTANQMPTMVETVWAPSVKEIGCFPRKRNASLENRLAGLDKQLNSKKPISRSAPPTSEEARPRRRRQASAGRLSAHGRFAVDPAIGSSSSYGVAWQSSAGRFDRQ